MAAQVGRSAQPESGASRAPILIVGTERSGSNLLRLILNAHSGIAAPHPPHLMRYLSPLEASYGDLGAERNLRRLVRDALRLVRVHIYPWETRIEEGQVLERVADPDVLGVFVAIYDAFLATSGKRRWACKSTFMIHFAEPMLERYPDARLVWLVRDPRDVAASSRESVFSPCHPYFTAELWRRQQQEGVALVEACGPAVVHRLRYEDLIADPEGSVEALCRFLDEPFEPAMLRYFETPEAVKSGALSESWRNTARPIRSSPVGRFRTDLSAAEVRLVEVTAGPLMARLGYPFESGAEGAGGGGGRLRYRLWDLVWRLRVEARSLVRDRNHWRRWARDAFVLYLRWRPRRPAAEGG